MTIVKDYVRTLRKSTDARRAYVRMPMGVAYRYRADSQRRRAKQLTRRAHGEGSEVNRSRRRETDLVDPGEEMAC